MQRRSSPIISLIPVSSPLDWTGVPQVEFYSPEKKSPGTKSPPTRLSTSKSRSSVIESGFGEGEKTDQIRWKKTIQVLEYLPPTETYYDYLPIKPGFFFLESLLKAPNADLRNLRINIPTTLYFSNHLYLLYTGCVQCDPEGHFISFLKVLEGKKPTENRNPFDQVAAVLRVKGGVEQDMKKHVLDWQMFRQKMVAHDLKPCTMLQEFIRSPGGKPAVIRLIYYVSTKQTKANVGYLVSSAVHMNPHSDLLHKTTVDINLRDGVELFKQTGKSLKPFEQQARSLVDFIQRGYRVRVDEIVLDFLKATDGSAWLCGCKGFRLDSSTVPQSIHMTSTFSPFYQTHPERGWEEKPKMIESKEKGNFVTCRLCRLQYANHQLPHSVSVKMLFLFKKHASRRVKIPIETSHLKVMSADQLSQTVRICACCFMVVTAEHALISAEREFALALNVPIKYDDFDEETKPGFALQFLPKTLMQYRILCHFISLETNDSIDQNQALFLHFKLKNARTVFALEKIEEIDGLRRYPIRALRLIYIFGLPDKPIKTFWQEVKVEVTLTNDPVLSAGKVLAYGSSPMLRSFPSDMNTEKAIYSKHPLSLFDPTGKIRFPLDFGIGLSCDHQSDPSQLPVGLKKAFDAFLPEEHYYNADPLPTDWMSIFGIDKKEESFDQDVGPEDAYDPLINAGELNRMQDITSPYPASLSNKLVVARRQSEKANSVGMIRVQSSNSMYKLNPGVQVTDISQVDRNTDSRVLSVLSLVDTFLRLKPRQESVKPEPDTKVRVLRMRKSCCDRESSPPVRQASSRLRTSSTSTRLHSGQSSARSVSPLEVRKALSKEYLNIVRLANKAM